MDIKHNNNDINNDNIQNNDFDSFSKNIEDKIANLANLSTPQNIRKIYNIKSLLKQSNAYKIVDIKQLTTNEFTDSIIYKINNSNLYSVEAKKNLGRRVDKINKLKGNFQDVVLTKNFSIFYRLLFIAFDINKEFMNKISRSTDFRASIEQLHTKLLKIFNNDKRLFYEFLDTFFVIKFGKSDITFETFFSKKLMTNIKEENFHSISLKQSDHKEIVKKFNTFIENNHDAFIKIQEERFGLKQYDSNIIFAGVITELFKELLESSLAIIREIYDFKNTATANLKRNNNFKFLTEIERESKTTRFFNSVIKAIIKYNKEISEAFIEHYTITNIKSLFSLNEQHQNALLFSLGNIAITEENSLLHDFKYSTDKQANFKIDVFKNISETNKFKSEALTRTAITGSNQNGIDKNTNVLNTNMTHEMFFLKSDKLIHFKRQRGETYSIKYLHNYITLDVIQSIGEFVIVENDLLQKSL